MLSSLHVKNLALIQEAEVEFGPGLNILTGETGAGKSILIGSINLALGKKLSREMIREGADSALVELVFETENPKVEQALKEMEIESLHGQVLIVRKITGSRSISKINGETCTTAQVRRIASLLLDIHGQHEHQSLLYTDRQLEILDAYGKEEIDPLRARVREAFRQWKELRDSLKEYELDEDARMREISFLEFEIREIDDAQLRDGEDETLEQAYRKMSNARNIVQALAAVRAMTGDGEGQSAGEQIGRAVRELSQIAGMDESLQQMQSSLLTIDDLLNDFNRELAGYMEEFTFSEEEFYETEKRLDEINRLKAKYGDSIPAIRRYQEEKQEKLEKMLHFEEQKEKLQKEEQKHKRSGYEAEIQKNRNMIFALGEFTAKRSELAFSRLKMPNIRIQLYELIRSTGELKNVFRLLWRGREYQTLSTSEQILAGVETCWMLRRILDLDYPVYIDNTESIQGIHPGFLPSQVIFLRHIPGQELTVRTSGASFPQEMKKAG